MKIGAIYARKGTVLTCVLLLGIVGVLTCGRAVWASTRFGDDIEVQAWYRMRHTFQYDRHGHFDWAQWRNEAFVWLTYENMVKNGQLQLGAGVPVPLVESASVSARFRARVDPVYYLRDHYRTLYDHNHRSDFFAPEKSFRDLYIDLDHGEVGPGRLSTRWGYQQIVWGESDLYRSLDIINPLRIDQNSFIGEKFDEFRTPILATKWLYGIGNVGTWLADVNIEAYYTPRWRSGSTNLLLEDGWRIQFQERSCMTPDGQVHPYSPENCATARKFLPMRPNWVGWRRQRNPWSIFAVGPTGNITSPDFGCVTHRCASDVANDRVSVIYNIMKGKGTHHTRGTNPGMNASAGARLLGTTWNNVNFSLDYIYIPTGPYGDGREFPANRQLSVYGDFPFAGVAPQGSFEEGLRQCLSESGKSSTRKTPAPTKLVVITGADLRGYDWPTRRLDANGNLLPTAKQPQAARVPITICANGPKHTYRHTHVIGFTATYNDFDYTGAIFRLEESISTSEYMNRYPAGYGVEGDRTNPAGRTLFHPQPVWRSMVGFDLFQSLQSYPGMGWTRTLPGGIGTQASFLSFQWLMKYNPATSNTFCEWNNAVGIGPSVPADGPPVREAKSGCRDNHWNHFFTLGFAGQGYFASKLEQRLAVAFEPRAQQWLLYGQWWWRNWLGMPLDLSMGTSWFPSSRFDNSWTLLNYYTDRNLLWLEATYYLL
ncbi:MAG TPA: DUF1302 family protein [Candidatus Binatia bacterium]|jgi:hypothetical protein|nr:DUF1302 family protein [Candidatus Binatia bacterium]